MTLAGYDVPKPTIWYDAQGNVGELAWFICYDSDIGGCNMQGDAGHSPSTFNAIADAIQSKYDMTCEYETLQNGFGAQFQNEFCEYEHNGITLRTQTYHKGIDQGRISIFVKNDSIDRTQDL
jgi:hypothetical protein